MNVHLGTLVDSEDALACLPPRALLRHMMALGSSGSGKTVLCKVVVEEAVRCGLPVICIDPQGDLCSLALFDSPKSAEKVSEDAARLYRERADVVVFTPASRKGIPLCADPIALPSEADLPHAEKLAAQSRAAAMLVSLLGFDLDSDEGAGLSAVIDTALGEMEAAGRPAARLSDLADYFAALKDTDIERYARYVDERKIRSAQQRLARLDVGARKLLFHDGIPIDIDALIGRDSTAVPGKVRVSVIYLNTLHSQEDKDFFIAALVDRLYQWMLKHPSSEPQALFYIDEVAPFIPPVRKPACKEGLTLLFKQARKYGLCCLMATQNPGDVDYKAMAQFGTWALGRLTTRQDLKKVEPIVKSLAPDDCDAIMESLPGKRPGEFALLSPDHFESVQALKARWLLSNHKTLDEDAIEALADERWRERFGTLASGHLAASGPASKPAPKPVMPAKPEREPAIDIIDEPEAPDDSRDFDGLDEPEALDEPEEIIELTPALRRQPKRAAPVKARAVAPEPEVPEVPEVPEEPTKLKDIKNLKDPEEQRGLDHDEGSEEGSGDRDSNDNDDELKRMARALGAKRTMNARELAERCAISERKARTVLKGLVESGLARSYKEGRETRYFATHIGARPDLGLGKQVAVVTAAVSEARVRELARDMVRGKLLGILGDAEEFDRAELVYRPVYQVVFEETVKRSGLRRLVGPSHDELHGTLYLHPQTLHVLTYSPRRGIEFHDNPGELASDVEDFDGIARFNDVPPASIAIDELAWAGRRSITDVKRAFRDRFNATPGTISPVFVPLWSIRLRQRERGNYRVIWIDALVGEPVSWPVE